MSGDKVMFKNVDNASMMGGLWCMGWLFTLGFLDVSFFKGLLAIILWPYYIGQHIATLMK